MSKVELVLQLDSILGESPLWSAEEGLLYWIDILGQKLYSFDPELEEFTALELSEKVTSIGLKKGGGLVATLWKGFATLDPRTGKFKRLAKVEEDLPNNRFNDGKCDRMGRFWAGTLSSTNPMEPSGGLYYLDAKEKVIPSSVKNAISLNGPAWSLDNKTIYVVETFPHKIFAYDFDLESGSLSNKRLFISFEASGGCPDGLTVDSEDCIWAAVQNTGQVVRIDPKGRILQEYTLPVPIVTSCTFGGSDVKTLYITTARENFTVDDIKNYPLSGSLFAIQTDVQGVLEPLCDVHLNGET